MLSGNVQGSFLDDSTSCFELLLEPSALEVVLQQKSAPIRDSASQNGVESNIGDKGSERLAIAGRPAASSSPAQPGLTLLLRCVPWSLNAALHPPLDRLMPCLWIRFGCELPENGLLKPLQGHHGAELQHLLVICGWQFCGAASAIHLGLAAFYSIGRPLCLQCAGRQQGLWGSDSVSGGCRLCAPWLAECCSP